MAIDDEYRFEEVEPIPMPRQLFNYVDVADLLSRPRGSLISEGVLLVSGITNPQDYHAVALMQVPAYELLIGREPDLLDIDRLNVVCARMGWTMFEAIDNDIRLACQYADEDVAAAAVEVERRTKANRESMRKKRKGTIDAVVIARENWKAAVRQKDEAMKQWSDYVRHFHDIFVKARDNVKE